MYNTLTASTTLTRPPQDSHDISTLLWPLQHSHGLYIISRPQLALSQSLMAPSLFLHHKYIFRASMSPFTASRTSSKPLLVSSASTSPLTASTSTITACNSPHTTSTGTILRLLNTLKASTSVPLPQLALSRLLFSLSRPPRSLFDFTKTLKALDKLLYKHSHGLSKHSHGLSEHSHGL
jgi:hypothetical protein